ncbi:helix-turn-helix domain-containing protein [Novosphingobium percolationis]|uniref:helix-turn-helix domain-containing protein n=1 Tax=Novosphingobium percolationis TaxID=2871811 RepID=UPI001CD723F7|nr:helix-turn-helix domain-containing protein [Novosphingobium percolationis]
MPARRVNPNRVKMHRTYSVPELAGCLEVHKNTVRHWQQAGLEPIDKVRPLLFHGETVRRFLTARNRDRKQSCGLGQMYCLRCRAPREPALGMVDYVALKATSGNLRGICDTCGTVMHRSARRDDLGRIMPGLTVQFVEAPERLSGRGSPSLNCDFGKRGDK